MEQRNKSFSDKWVHRFSNTFHLSVELSIVSIDVWSHIHLAMSNAFDCYKYEMESFVHHHLLKHLLMAEKKD